MNSKNKIETIKGLDEVFTLIHTGDIERTLGKVEEGLSERRQANQAYVEDWKLRKQVIDFLHQQQVPGIEPLAVYEPKNHFRRLDTNTDTDFKELTMLFTIETADGYGIVWENIDLSGDRATYIFKTLKEDLIKQIIKIKEAIASFAQFRSALTSSKQSDELVTFKASFGYVKTIRKQRGKNAPFDNWKSKLESALSIDIPHMPSAGEMESINAWSPEVPHKPNSSRLVKKIRDEDIATIKLDFNAGMKAIRSETIIKPDTRQKLLASFQSFNTFFLQDFDL